MCTPHWSSAYSSLLFFCEFYLGDFRAVILFRGGGDWVSNIVKGIGDIEQGAVILWGVGNIVCVGKGGHDIVRGQ